MVQTLKTATAVAAALLLAALLTSCGEKETHQKIMADTLGLMDRVVSAVESVEDKQSAEAAAQKLEDMVGDFEQIADRIKGIGEPDEATEKALEDDYAKRREEIMQKMESSMLGVASRSPEIMNTLMQPMEKIGKVLDKVM